MNKKGQDSGMGALIGGIILFVAILIGGLIIMNLGFDTVEANQIGVMKQFGQVKGIMQPGMRWTGLFTDVVLYSTALRKTEMQFSGDQSAWDRNKRNIYLDVSVNWKIKPENVDQLYRQVPHDADVESMLNVQNIIAESVKQVTPKYDVENLQNDREAIKEEIKTQITKNFPTQFLSLENVVVSNIDLAPDYKKEINDAARAIVQAQKEQQMVDVVKYQQAQLTETKNGEVARIKLDADAAYYARTKAADGEAYQILAAAKSQAEGYNLKKQELNPLLVQMALVDKWQGGVPSIVTDNSNLIMPVGNIMAQLGANIPLSK